MERLSVKVFHIAKYANVTKYVIVQAISHTYLFQSDVIEYYLLYIWKLGEYDSTMYV